MSRSSRITRIASTIGAGGIAVLALSVPTVAFGVPTGGGEGVDVGAALNGNVHVDPVDVGAARNGNVNPTRIDVRALLRDIDRPLPAYQPPTSTAAVTSNPVDDNAIELIQLALGAAAGTALTAAGLGAFTARNRRRSAQSTM